MTFVMTPRFMLLKYKKVLRIFAILLFSIEILTLVSSLGASENHNDTGKGFVNIASNHQTLDLLNHLICEEVNSEERKDKDDCFISVSFVEVFNELEKFQSVQIAWLLPKDRFDTQPSLFTLHRVLLI